MQTWQEMTDRRGKMGLMVQQVMKVHRGWQHHEELMGRKARMGLKVQRGRMGRKG